MNITKGTTSYIEYIFIPDSASAVGAGLTGLVYNSSGLVASYVRAGAARAALTLATQTVTGAFSSGGFVEVDATNAPGIYRLDIPNAVFANGVKVAIVHLQGATNMVPVTIRYKLTDLDDQATVKSDVVEGLAIDTYAEPGQEAPGATVSIEKKISYLYKLMRNKVTQTTTTFSVYDDAGITVDQKSTVSDDGTTFVRGKIGTGA